MEPALISGESERARVLTKAVVRAADRLRLTGKELAAILGVSAPTVSRMRAESVRLEIGSKPFEIGALFVRLFRSLDALTGGEAQVAQTWLRNDNLALGGRPIDQIKTVSGLTNGLAYLDSRRAPL